MEIRKQFNEGKTSEQVWQDLQLKYGSQLRMEPETGGREALAYWLPWGSFLFITALLILIWFTRKSRKPPPTVPAVPSREKEIIEDLRRREGL
jgi:cytochrome c-type biogenesis protein CcmH/NrfF